MKVKTIFFSPTGGTGKIAATITESIRENLGPDVSNVIYCDITLPENRAENILVSKDDLAILAFPTYAGKLPNKLLPDLQRIIRGDGGPAVVVTTFGNRSFDNSLAEAFHLAQTAGFNVVAAASLVCEHPFSDKLGTGRPDFIDLAEISAFSGNIADRLAPSPEDAVLKALGLINPAESDTKSNFGLNTADIPGEYDAPYYTPKKADGTPASFLKAKVKTDSDLCDGCGLCSAYCPFGSISKQDPSFIEGPCVKCHACVKICPKKAKIFDDPDFLSHVEYLENNHSKRKPNRFFLPR